MTIIKSYLTKFDTGQSISLNLKGDNEVRSCFGGCLNLAMQLLAFKILLNMGYTWFLRKEIEINQFSTYYDSLDDVVDSEGHSFNQNLTYEGDRHFNFFIQVFGGPIPEDKGTLECWNRRKTSHTKDLDKIELI
jgi:hypothetical protein